MSIIRSLGLGNVAVFLDWEPCPSNEMATALPPFSKAKNKMKVGSNILDYEAIEELADQHIADLHALYQQEWWTKGRELPDIGQMIEHSDVIVAFVESRTGQLVGFARVITDFVYKALILDVIIKESCRGKGLGRSLMDRIIGHRSLQKIQHFELYCRPEMLPFYRQWGFTEDLGELQFMRRGNRVD